MRDNCVCATNARESGGLTEAAEFNGASASARNFVNGVRELFVADVAVVCTIEQNNCTRFVGVIHKLLERFTSEHGTGRVVRAAKINQLDRILGQVRLEVVFSC